MQWDYFYGKLAEFFLPSFISIGMLVMFIVWHKIAPANWRFAGMALINILLVASVGLYQPYWVVPSLFLLFVGLGYLVATVAETSSNRLLKNFSLLYPIVGIAGFLFVLPKVIEVPITPDLFSASENTILIFGVSYICLRMFLYTLNIQAITQVSPATYVAYVLYFPACFVGPLSDPERFLKSIQVGERQLDLSFDIILRVLLGLVKLLFLSGLASRLAFDSIIFDGNYHSAISIFVASWAFYFTLWLNFSGACDIVIGFSSIFRIKLDENFNDHWRALSISDFWARWHMTLSSLLKQAVFSPVCMVLMRRTRGQHRQFIVSFSLFLTFSMVAAWHGLGLNWLVFGLMHGLAMMTWSLWRGYKMTLAENIKFKRFLESRLYGILCWNMTHNYVAVTLIFFANDFDRIETMLKIVAW
jgi:D-alanyl-lipoteichoic acid acyltransferase DltB (MBOAT superfamily)